MSNGCEGKCPYSESIHEIRGDIKEIRKDVKGLLKFKWQLMAGAGTVGFVISAIVSYLKLLA